MNLSATDIKAFVPATDLERSKQFYQALAFEIVWSSEALAHIRLGHCGFLLQSFDAPAFSRNFQMHLLVENVDDWYAHVLATGVLERFDVSAEPPQDRPWGMRDFPLVDPSGVLWRIAQRLPNR